MNLEWIVLNGAAITEFCALVGVIGGMIRWSHVKLHADMMEIKEDCKRAHDRIDAMGQRIDGICTRLDHMYTIMMAHITGIKPTDIK